MTWRRAELPCADEIVRIAPLVEHISLPKSSFVASDCSKSTALRERRQLAVQVVRIPRTGEIFGCVASNERMSSNLSPAQLIAVVEIR
jgi:hypothetical protein